MKQGNRLRALRRARGIRTVELARAAGVTEGYIAQIERGLRIPSWRVASAIAGYMEVGVFEIFMEEQMSEG